MNNMNKVTRFDEIVGQNRVVRILIRMLERGRMAHAMLFTGIDGCGRRTTATVLAMTLNCRNLDAGVSCGHCGSCRKILSGNHPDVVSIVAAGAYIKIDQIRALRKQLRFAPIEGGYRIIIVNDAHKMNPEASNALLKTLEEPPDDTHIVLTAPETNDLVETIVSRCQHVAFRPIGANTIAAFLQEQESMAPDTARCIALLAGGSLGKALGADAQNWAARRSTLMKTLATISDAPLPALFDFAEDLSSDKNKIQETLGLVSLWYRDLLMSKLCPHHVLNKDYDADIVKNASRYDVGDILRKLSAVFSTQRNISRNANSRLALDVLSLQLGSVGVRGFTQERQGAIGVSS
jgi:DNA polymerase-3 subunit delta'